MALNLLSIGVSSHRAALYISTFILSALNKSGGFAANLRELTVLSLHTQEAFLSSRPRRRKPGHVCAEEGQRPVNWPLPKLRISSYLDLCYYPYQFHAFHSASGPAFNLGETANMTSQTSFD